MTGFKIKGLSIKKLLISTIVIPTLVRVLEFNISSDDILLVTKNLKPMMYYLLEGLNFGIYKTYIELTFPVFIVSLITYILIKQSLYYLLSHIFTFLLSGFYMLTYFIKNCFQFL